ncbi:hypothetical protein [Puerhibacterium puerhi]|uniref:hypothetical protein n=1 Tax=Puerhibacterium puerhi TaxID=2692623 RepID=UPI00135678EA|nr:hypothetical protein [Puerhibacterium puerhi]
MSETPALRPAPGAPTPAGAAAGHPPAARSAPWPWPRTAAWLALGALAAAGLLVGGALLDGGALDSGPGGGSPGGAIRLDAVSATTPATAVGVAALCYLAAAASGRRWASWAAVPVASALPFLAEVLGVPRWTAIAAAGAVLVALGALARRGATWPQALAMVGWFGACVVALELAPRVGLALAGAALAAHAAWDAVHYRRDAVVHRSLAVWCMGLDVLLGGACLALAAAG